MPRSSISPDSRSARSLRKRYSLPAPSDSRLFLQTIRYGLSRVPQWCARPMISVVVRGECSRIFDTHRVGGRHRVACRRPERTGRHARVVGGRVEPLDSAIRPVGVAAIQRLARPRGISNSVLSSRLAVLTAGGMLERREYQQNPPRHEYSVTRKGQSNLARPHHHVVVGEAVGRPTKPSRFHHCGTAPAETTSPRSCAARSAAEDVDVRSLDSQMGPSGDFSRSVPEATSRRRSTKSERRPEILAHTMELVGNRWSAAIIGAAFRGARRYGEFAEITGAPPAIVADRLKHLTEIGVMETRRFRIAHSGRSIDSPPRARRISPW